MYRNIIVYLILLANLIQCQHFFLRDAENFNLSEQEANLLRGKKIGGIGFRIFYTKKSSSDKKENTLSLSYNLIRTLQFLYQKKESEIIEISNHFFIENKELSSDTTANYFFPYLKNLETTTSKPDETISEENLRNFLKTYLDNTYHLGYSEIVNLLDFSDKNKIFLKKNDFEYWIIGFHGMEKKDHTLNIFKMLNETLYLYSIGIIPLWSSISQNSSFWIFDNKLNLIRKIDINNDVSFLMWICLPPFTGQ